ncbi:MAG: hypothetical protein IPM29_03540 [Planctomycetes bacterium]|nr:hypothetical protein [Planctomycetota bacterium]
MRRIARTAVFVAFAAVLNPGFALAQELPETGGQHRERVEREIAERERQMREGRVVESNVRITVRLTNGSRMRGIIRNGRFVERHDGLEFVSSDVRTPGAGIRLWYFSRSNSYVFLPFEQIKEHTIGQVLTDEEVAQIGLELERAEQERKLRQAPTPPAAPPGAAPQSQSPADGAAPGAGGPEGTPDAEVPTLTAEQQALLTEFPPDAGWGLAKLQELERRKIVIGVFPNDKEKRFIDNFAAWQEAFRLQKEIEERSQGTPPTGGLPPLPQQGPPPAGPLPQPGTGTPVGPPAPGRRR